MENRDELYIQLLIGKVSESLGFNKTVEIVKEVNDALRKPVVSGSISLEVATKRIRQVVEYSKYKSWNNEVGEQRAKYIMDDFHNGFYGSKNGMWVQVNEAVELLEYLYSR